MSTNVLAHDFLMADSTFHIYPVDNHSAKKVDQSDFSSDERNCLQFILGIVICSIGITILLAPEQPKQFASICEKYNDVNACYVW